MKITKELNLEGNYIIKLLDDNGWTTFQAESRHPSHDRFEAACLLRCYLVVRHGSTHRHISAHQIMSFLPDPLPAKLEVDEVFLFLELLR